MRGAAARVESPRRRDWPRAISTRLRPGLGYSTVNATVAAAGLTVSLTVTASSPGSMK